MKKLLLSLILLFLFSFFSKSAYASVLYSSPLNGSDSFSTDWTAINSESGSFSSAGLAGQAQYYKNFSSYDQILKFDVTYTSAGGYALAACRANNGSDNSFPDVEQFYFDGNSNDHIDQCVGGACGGIGGTYTGDVTGTHHIEEDCIGNTITLKVDGSTIDSATASNSYNTSATGVRLYSGNSQTIISNLEVCDSNGCTSPTPTPVPNTITVSPSTSTVTVGQPFNATIAVSGGTAFNAAAAHVALSSNLSITGIHSAPSPECNFQYTQTPTTSDPSFAGAIFGSSSTSCNVYTLTLTPNAAGTGTITLTNGSIKSYADNSEINTGVTNGSFTINAANATPTPTPSLSGITFTSPSETYNSTYTLTGTKDSSTTTVFINGSSTGVTYPTNTTWQVTETLTLGANNTAGSNTFTVYGTDGTNQTATVTDTVSLHELGDINGDGVVDLTDASLFATDWGKTDISTFTYILSDMNGNGSVDLTDLSILAKLEAQ